VRAATLALLTEKGPSGVTIADVSERAGVSVGTIYGRVGNRANLLRIVQEEELERIRSSMTERLDDLRARQEHSVSGVIEVYVGEMEVSAQSIRALVAAAAEVDELSEAGPASWRAVRSTVLSALRSATDAPPHGVSEPWLVWIFEVIDATTVQHLEAVAASDERGETELVDNLSRTVRLLLEADPLT
jgi:AcrR family transcriptional regulator